MLKRAADSTVAGVFAIALIFVLGSGWLITVLSHPPSPASRPEASAVPGPAETRQRQHADDQRGTEDTPLVVKLQNTQKTKAEAERDVDYQQRRAADNDVFNIGIATIVVGALQTIALVVTFSVVAFVAVRELRAYVYPEVTGLKRFSLTEPIVVTVSWRNRGRTPAREFETHGLVWIGELPLDDRAKFEERGASEPSIGRHSKSALFPDTDRRIDYDSVFRGPLTDSILKCITEKKMAIYVLGRAFYRDIFRLRRRTEICAFIDPDDAAKLIEAERKNLPLDIEVRFNAAHVLNDFT
jgi:hypothetical protein